MLIDGFFCHVADLVVLDHLVNPEVLEDLFEVPQVAHTQVLAVADAGDMVLH